MLDGLYLRIIRGIRTRTGKFLLGVLAVLESTIVPVTIELVAAPLMAVSRQPYVIANIILIGTIVGALLGYALGFFMFEPIIKPLLERVGWMDEYQVFEKDILANGFWAVFLVGLTPIPFQIGTVGAGVVGYSLPLFIVAVTISRAIRYYALALLADILGRRARKFLNKYQSVILFGGIAVLLIGYLLVLWLG